MNSDFTLITFPAFKLTTGKGQINAINKTVAIKQMQLAGLEFARH